MANFSSSHTGAEIDSAVGRLKSTAVTAGTVAASSGVCVDSNKDITGFRNITLTGQLTAATISLTGDTDIGDAAGDTVTITAQVDSNVVPSADNTYDLGSSTKEWKDIYIDGTAYLDAINFNGTAITSTAAELNILDGVTSTAAELNILDGVTSTAAEINILDGVTSTATELNIMDGGTSATSTTLADADRVVVNDGGTMKQVALTDFETYFESALDTLSNVTSVGTLTSLTTSGNIGLGVTPDTWHSSYDALQGANFSLCTDATAGASKAVTLAYNQYIDSGNAWTYINADEASYYQQYNGDHYFATADAGSADGDVTNNTRLVIKNGGFIGIGLTSPSEILHLNSATAGGDTTIRLDHSNSGRGNFYLRSKNSGNQNWFVIGEETDGDFFTIMADNDGSGGGAGRVGIGDISPDTKLHINDSGVDKDVMMIEGAIAADEDWLGIGFRSSARRYARIAGGSHTYAPDYGMIKFEVSDSADTLVEKMRIEGNSGNVGIGTTAPVSTTHIYENTTATDSSAGLTIEQAGTGDAILQFLETGTQRWVVGLDNSDSDKFKISSDGDLNSNARLTIDTSGKVGIGDSSPAAKLVVVGDSSIGSTTNGLYFGNTSGIGYIQGTDTEGSAYNALGFKTSANYALYIDTSDNVGIGTTAPDQILHCKVASGDPSIVCETESGGGARLKLIGTDNNMSIQSSGGLNFYTGASTTLNGTERMRLTSGGALQVGDFSSASHFQVKASYANEYIARIHNDGDGEQYYGLWIQCGHDNASDQNFAITIADGDGGEQGYVTFSGGTVAYGPFTANHDAELPDSDNGNGYPYGTLVETTEIFYKQKNDQDTERGILYKVKKSSSAYSKKVLGAYSSKFPTDMYENQHQIYVLGDGHILCNGEKGNIEIGDGICSSSTEGEGMKADQTTMIIGIAQEDVSFSGSESKLVVVQYGLQQFTPWENA